MRHRVAILAAVLLTGSACFLAPPDPPAAPSLVVPAPVPAAIKIDVQYGIGNGAGRAFITGRVRDASDRSISVPVALSVSSGQILAGASVTEIATASAITVTSDFTLGQFQAVVVGRGAITFMASAGSIAVIVPLLIP